MIFTKLRLHLAHIEAQPILSSEFCRVYEMIYLLALIKIVIHVLFLLCRVACPQDVPIVGLCVNEPVSFQNNPDQLSLSLENLIHKLLWIIKVSYLREDLSTLSALIISLLLARRLIILKASFLLLKEHLSGEVDKIRVRRNTLCRESRYLVIVISFEHPTASEVFLVFISLMYLQDLKHPFKTFSFSSKEKGYRIGLSVQHSRTAFTLFHRVETFFVNTALTVLLSLKESRGQL
jgi:hypothetical protein